MLVYVDPASLRKISAILASAGTSLHLIADQAGDHTRVRELEPEQYSALGVSAPSTRLALDHDAQLDDEAVVLVIPQMSYVFPADIITPADAPPDHSTLNPPPRVFDPASVNDLVGDYKVPVPHLRLRPEIAQQKARLHKRSQKQSTGGTARQSASTSASGSKRRAADGVEQGGQAGKKRSKTKEADVAMPAPAISSGGRPDDDSSATRPQIPAEALDSTSHEPRTSVSGPTLSDHGSSANRHSTASPSLSHVKCFTPSEGSTVDHRSEVGAILDKHKAEITVTSGRDSLRMEKLLEAFGKCIRTPSKPDPPFSPFSPSSPSSPSSRSPRPPARRPIELLRLAQLHQALSNQAAAYATDPMFYELAQHGCHLATLCRALNILFKHIGRANIDLQAVDFGELVVLQADYLSSSGVTDIVAARMMDLEKYFTGIKRFAIEIKTLISAPRNSLDILARGSDFLVDGQAGFKIKPVSTAQTPRSQAESQTSSLSDRTSIAGSGTAGAAGASKTFKVVATFQDGSDGRDANLPLTGTPTLLICQAFLQAHRNRVRWITIFNGSDALLVHLDSRWQMSCSPEVISNRSKKVNLLTAVLAIATLSITDSPDWDGFLSEAELAKTSAAATMTTGSIQTASGISADPPSSAKEEEGKRVGHGGLDPVGSAKLDRSSEPFVGMASVVYPVGATASVFEDLYRRKSTFGVRRDDKTKAVSDSSDQFYELTYTLDSDQDEATAPIGRLWQVSFGTATAVTRVSRSDTTENIVPTYHSRPLRRARNPRFTDVVDTNPLHSKYQARLKLEDGPTVGNVIGGLPLPVPDAYGASFRSTVPPKKPSHESDCSGTTLGSGPTNLILVNSRDKGVPVLLRAIDFALSPVLIAVKHASIGNNAERSAVRNEITLYRGKLAALQGGTVPFLFGVQGEEHVSMATAPGMEEKEVAAAERGARGGEEDSGQRSPPPKVVMLLQKLEPVFPGSDKVSEGSAEARDSVEVVDGVDVRDRAFCMRLPEGYRLAILQLFRKLHNAGVVHGDVALRHIMYDPDEARAAGFNDHDMEDDDMMSGNGLDAADEDGNDNDLVDDDDDDGTQLPPIHTWRLIDFEASTVDHEPSRPQIKREQALLAWFCGFESSIWYAI